MFADVRKVAVDVVVAAFVMDMVAVASAVSVVVSVVAVVALAEVLIPESMMFPVTAVVALSC